MIDVDSKKRISQRDGGNNSPRTAPWYDVGMAIPSGFQGTDQSRAEQSKAEQSLQIPDCVAWELWTHSCDKKNENPDVRWPNIHGKVPVVSEHLHKREIRR